MGVIRYISGLIFISFFLLSCHRERERDNVVARDAAFAEQLYGDVFNIVNSVASSTDGIRTLELPCVDTVIVDTLSFPKTLVIDFGEDDCFGNDGRVRKGKILVSLTGRYSHEGTTISVTTDNYRVDQAVVNINKTITNAGLNAQAQPYFLVEITGEIVTNEGSMTYSSSRVRTWVNGFSTTDWQDDVYEITGEASGTNRNGKAFSVNIEQALRMELNCAWISSGKLRIEPEQGESRLLDFGSGNCNSGYTVLVGDETYIVNGGD